MGINVFIRPLSAVSSTIVEVVKTINSYLVFIYCYNIAYLGHRAAKFSFGQIFIFYMCADVS